MTYCQNCGKKLEEQSKFCGSCGSSLSKAERIVTDVVQKKDHTRFIVVTVAIVVGVLALITILLYFEVHLFLLRLIAWLWTLWGYY